MSALEVIHPDAPALEIRVLSYAAWTHSKYQKTPRDLNKYMINTWGKKRKHFYLYIRNVLDEQGMQLPGKYSHIEKAEKAIPAQKRKILQCFTKDNMSGIFELGIAAAFI